MRFHLSNTHAYPGCPVKITDHDNQMEVIAEFSDGVIVPCQHKWQDGKIIIVIAAHRTARGTAIGEKTWILRPSTTEGEWKITTRVPPDA